MDRLSEILDKLSENDLRKLKILFQPEEGVWGPKETVTLRVLCNEYRDFIKQNRSKSYYKSVDTSLKHLTDYFGLQRPVRSISYKEAEEFITNLQQKVKKGYRIYYRTLKAAFNKAIDWKYIDENCFIKVKLPKKQKLNPAFINDNQLQKILKQINVDVVRDVTLFAYNTGMRLNEIVNLKWKNIDFEKKIITVGDEEFETKGKNQRYIPFSAETEKILAQSVVKQRVTSKLKVYSLSKDKNRGYVFGKENGRPFTGDYFSKRFKRACKSAGMDNSIHFHSLRHSFASNLAQKGVSLYVIKELLGHSSIATTEIYSHLNLDTLKEAVKLLDDRKEYLTTIQGGKTI